jgi:surfeit locus 1 family protein
LIELAFGKGMPPALMLVTDQPAPGLQPNAGPDLSSIPNNHLSYAVQWFLFALIAVVIYALALRKRWRGE